MVLEPINHAMHQQVLVAAILAHELETARVNSRNPLAVYKLSAILRSLNRKPFFWISTLVLALLVGVGTAPADASQRTSRKAAAQAAAKAATAKRVLYSAQRAQTRRSKLATARAIATAREMASTVLPRYKMDAAGDLVPDVRAAAAIIYNPETNEVLWEENSQDQRSIASITKVMTATVFLENNPDLFQTVTVARPDVFQASTTHLKANDRVTADDLLHLLLIASDNAAARVLARISPYGTDGFVRRMNEKAQELGLESTNYADPSGLLSENVSSAYDMARLITHASQDERIASVMRMQTYTVYTANRRQIVFHSTNHLLGRQDVDVRAGKTGFISKAGYCLATLLRLPDTDQKVAVVVLGARSNAGRFMETRNLFSWLSLKASTILATKPPSASVAQQP
jgi:D-alanyl-D-alanine endopeptidase (penicillin-binding protein 7)